MQTEGGLSTQALAPLHLAQIHHCIHILSLPFPLVMTISCCFVDSEGSETAGVAEEAPPDVTNAEQLYEDVADSDFYVDVPQVRLLPLLIFT